MAFSIYKSLNIEKEEFPRVSLFLVLSIFIGFFYGALDVAAHALFLDVYPATFIPKAYIVSGLVGIVFTSLYTRLQQKYSFGIFATFNLISIVVFSFIIWSGFWFIPYKIIVFILFIFFGPLNILAALGFWGAVGRMFTLRQGKRIFGLIDSGQIIGIILSSYGATLILSLGVKTRDLLLASAASIALALLLQIIINRKFGYTAVQQEISDEKKKDTSLLNVLKKRYVMYLALFVMFSVAATFFIHYTFVTVSKENYPDTTSLAKFLGAFTGTMMIVTLLVKTLVYGRLVKTYGLKVILALSPILLGFFTIVSILLGKLAGFTAASSGFMLFFLIISLTKLFSKILRDSFEAPSFKVLYQALSSDIRYAVQSGVDGTINEITAFGSGLALAGLVSLPFVTTIHFVYILGFLLVLWTFVAIRLYHEYRNSLQSSLAAYEHQGSDESAFSLQDYLTSLYEKGSNTSKSFVISIASRIAPSLQERLAGKAEPVQLSENPSALVYAPDPNHRISCAFYLRGQNSSDKVRLLRILLHDNDASVRKAAIQTAGQDKVLEVAPLVIEQLAHPSTYPWAYQALLAMGEPALESMEIFFKKTGLEEKVQIRIIRLMAEIGGSQASNLVLNKLGLFNRNLVKEAISALRRLKPAASPELEKIVNKTLQDFLTLLAYNTAAKASLPENEKLPLLASALDEESHELYLNVMNLLALLYDEKSVMLVKENLETGTREGIGYALELLDLFISDDLKRFLSPLLEDNTLSEKVHLLQEEYPVDKFSTPALLKYLMNRNSNDVSPVTRLIAIHTFSLVKNIQSPDDLIAQLFNENTAMAETAALTLENTDKDSLTKAFIRLKQSGFTELEDRFLRITKYQSQPSVLNMLLVLRACKELEDLDWSMLFQIAGKMCAVVCDNNNKELLAKKLAARESLYIIARGNYTEESKEGKNDYTTNAVLTPMQNQQNIPVKFSLADGSLLAYLPEEDLSELIFDNPELAQILSSNEPIDSPTVLS